MSRKNWRIKAGKAVAVAAKRPDEFAAKPFKAAGGPARITAEAAGEDGKPKLRRFAGNAYTGAPMRPEGWYTPIVVDLEGKVNFPASMNRPVLRQHDHEQIVGHTDSITVTAAGIEVEGPLSGEPQHTATVTVPADNGFQWQMSIGADPVRTEFLEAGETATVNGREVTGPLVISRETDLGEVSFVPLGADGSTSAVVSASKGGRVAMFKGMLKAAKAGGNVRAAKFNDDEIEKMDEAKAKAALKECMADADTDDDDKDAKADDDEKKAEAAHKARIKARRKAEADDEERADAIRATAKKHGVTLVKAAGKDVNFIAHAITEGWSADKAELEAMRAARPAGPLVFSTSTPEMSGAVLECAALQAAGCQLFDDDFYRREMADGEFRGRIPARTTNRIKAELKRQYPEQVQDAAHRVFKGQLGLQQMLTLIAREGGYRGRETISDGNLGEVAAACMRTQDRIEADGGSTISVGNVTSNVQNKFLLQGYLFTEQSWREFCGIRSTKDFKPTKSINLFGDVEFKDVGTSGELDNATLQDQAFANSVKTRGRILTIPRTTIINDDIGALGQVPMVMGRGAGLKLNTVVYTKFLNPGLDEGGSTNFFAATHTLLAGQQGNSNLSSGAGSALSSDGLTAAVLLFDNQVDPMGYPLGLDAEILLYPSDLQTKALELMNSENIVYGGASASKQPQSNIWRGRFKPVKSRYLNKSAFTGYSAAAWYLFANPNILPAIEVAFLNGQEMPTVQNAGPDYQFNVMGITTRAFFDMDANMQNFRGAVKSAGS